MNIAAYTKSYPLSFGVLFQNVRKIKNLLEKRVHRERSVHHLVKLGCVRHSSFLIHRLSQRISKEGVVPVRAHSIELRHALFYLFGLLIFVGSL